MASFDLVYASFSTFSFPHFCSRSQFVVPVRSLFRSSTFNIHQFSVVVVVFVVVIIVALAIIFAIEAVTVFLPAYFISSLFMSFSFDVVPPDRSPLQLFEFLFVLCPEKRKRIGIRKKSKFLLVQSTVFDLVIGNSNKQQQRREHSANCILLVSCDTKTNTAIFEYSDDDCMHLTSYENIRYNQQRTLRGFPATLQPSLLNMLCKCTSYKVNERKNGGSCALCV